MFVALAIAASALLSGGNDIECVIFQDGTMTHEEVMTECREFAETYEWEAPVYDEPVTECWTMWQFGLVDECPVGVNNGSYTVQDGDLSLWTISQKLGISFGALLDANSGDADLIRVGDHINLP